MSIPTAKWHERLRDVHQDRTFAAIYSAAKNCQGVPMLDIHFYCPVDQKNIDTGIQVDQITFERTRLNLIHVPCPHCSRIHRFLMADSHFVSRDNDDRRRLLARYEFGLNPLGGEFSRVPTLLSAWRGNRYAEIYE